MDSNLTTSSFENAIRLVRRRVQLLGFARWIRRGHWIAALVAVVLVFALRQFQEWRSGELWLALALIGSWILVGAAVSLWRRPGAMEALLTLDQRGGWKDRFSSAWEFLAKPDITTSEELHVTRAAHSVEEATQRLPESMPLPAMRYVWIAPLAALLFAASPLGRIAPEARDLLLTDEMRDAADEQAENLKKAADQMAKGEALTKEEKEELERLRVEVEDVADRLADADGLTAGEMLDSLEARARAAERLAGKMGLSDDAWASDEMLEEMAVHPDTADLSLSVKDKAAEQASQEATKLQTILENEGITRETVERFTDALDQIMAAAVEEDHERPVGERVGNASTKMLDQQPLTAAREFEELAKHFRFLGAREEAREKLEDLANSLRDAGSEISGSELQQMEKIANEGGSGSGETGGLQSIEAGAMPEDLQKMLAPQMAQSGAQSGQQSPAPGVTGETQPGGEQTTPVPGSLQENPDGEQGSGESLAMKAPIPGEPSQEGQGNGQGMGQSGDSQEGQGEGGLLTAPIPGMDPGETGQGEGAAMAGGSGNQTGQGGDQAGSGTAAMIDSQSEALAAAKDSEVVAQINDNGDSTFRAIEGQARQEQATRSRQEIISDFMAAEEQALDDQALPLSRREHVIRYFSEIRRQFEEPVSNP